MVLDVSKAKHVVETSATYAYNVLECSFTAQTCKKHACGFILWTFTSRILQRFWVLQLKGHQRARIRPSFRDTSDAEG